MNVRHAYTNTHKLESPAQTLLKRPFTPLPSCLSSHTNTHIHEHSSPPSTLSVASVCQSGVRRFSWQSVLSCCFVESGGLWGVSTGDRCGQTSFRRRCTGMVSLPSGSGGVGTARRTERTSIHSRATCRRMVSPQCASSDGLLGGCSLCTSYCSQEKSTCAF